jgi:hypothetical protein
MKISEDCVCKMGATFREVLSKANLRCTQKYLLMLQLTKQSADVAPTST